ncbi:exonuclease domain-containing protein [Microbacterium sp. C7(2022)]|uniref:exonuclease domain-containing protein n=1 Tax=Microbacterium sp. C7(2022) TaxID=2992759 RepID=UPI00237A67F9|nr:exonuclease domain-containing protein [Microbacterium sp. C7(2022)]MDE0546347.1 exonuclease domain-containing protein [Microbacterium sp. C7(2022)]
MGFAVVDFETTGILPSYHHRVVEIGVTHVEDDGTVTARWETLINPERDLGPQHIHGIRAADILDAPVFSDIAAEFADLLRGRVFAAHNAAFDLRFLRAEFERAGYRLEGDAPSMCTMRLGENFGLGASGSLAHACATHSIELAHAHSAGSDSFAAAQLLSHYQRSSATWPGWGDYWASAAAAGRAYRYPVGTPTGVLGKPRSEASAAPASFLERISTDAVRETVDGAAAEYLALLDRCLLDGFISTSEGAQLAEVAGELGLARAAIDGIHRDYFVDLERRAWADGVLTDDERADLRAVGALLQLDEASIAAAIDDEPPAAAADLERAGHFEVPDGAVIVLTGDMARERSYWEAALRSRGYVPHPTVTKKVALVVAADPDSLSGKAKKAREYGIPIVGESWLEGFLA